MFVYLIFVTTCDTKHVSVEFPSLFLPFSPSIAPSSSHLLLQDTSVQEEVEMMVESLLDVLLQTLLSIMSKSQSQEAVRGQRCPQCTAEITVSN